MLKSITCELIDFDRQTYFDESPERLSITNIRPRYMRIYLRKQALIIGMEDLAPFLEKSGLVQEEWTIQNEVDTVLTKITDIKPSFHDVVRQY